MNLLNPLIRTLLPASVCLVMLGCLLLIGGRVSPAAAWALIVIGGVLYFGIRLPQRWRERPAEDDNNVER